jgi:hypothetical protein
MGENDRHTKYNDIALICRDAQHVEQFLGSEPMPPPKPMDWGAL